MKLEIKLKNKMKIKQLLPTTENKNGKTLFIFTVTYVLLAIIGAYNNYSFVPLNDSWSELVNFFIRFQEEGVVAFWNQTNEHRIVLSRALFLIDLNYFNGNFIFLILLNYLFVFLSAVIFCLYLQESLRFKKDLWAVKAMFCFIIFIIFSWMQRENIIWEFQSQFLLAQLLPLLAFYLLHRFHDTNKISYFFLACLSGILSIGTMANGVLALPLLFLLSLVLNTKFWQKLTLSLISVITLYLYYYDYHSPIPQGIPLETIINQPLDLTRYILRYLGSPFYHLTGKGSHILSELMGLFFILISIYSTYKNLFVLKKSSHALSLLTFILFIGISAVGTACGRTKFGIEHAFPSRYSTPLLMGWSAIIILYSESLYEALHKRRMQIITPGLIILLALMALQFKTILPPKKSSFEKEIAALAIELGVKDYMQIKNVYVFDSNFPLKDFDSAKQKNISIFANPLIKDVAELIGEKESDDKNKLSGNIDKISAIDDESRFVAIEGLITDSNTPKIIHIVDKDNIIVGYTLTKKNFFKGYLLSDKVSNSLQLIGIDNH